MGERLVEDERVAADRDEACVGDNEDVLALAVVMAA